LLNDDPVIREDGVWESVEEAVRASLPADLDDDEKEAVADARRAKVKRQLAHWIKYGEYLSVEFDLDAGTATVLTQE
jgi:hypothetical protein